jgi:hypothetical protein
MKAKVYALPRKIRTVCNLLMKLSPRTLTSRNQAGQQKKEKEIEALHSTI